MPSSFLRRFKMNWLAYTTKKASTTAMTTDKADSSVPSCWYSRARVALMSAKADWLAMELKA